MEALIGGFFHSDFNVFIDNSSLFRYPIRYFHANSLQDVINNNFTDYSVIDGYSYTHPENFLNADIEIPIDEINHSGIIFLDCDINSIGEGNDWEWWIANEHGIINNKDALIVTVASDNFENSIPHDSTQNSNVLRLELQCENWDNFTEDYIWLYIEGDEVNYCRILILFYNSNI